jgi:hypothetical protein
LSGHVGPNPSDASGGDVAVGVLVAGSVGPGGSSASGHARAPAAVDPDRAAPGDNVEPWGPWSLSAVNKQIPGGGKIVIGYGANCNKHREPLCTLGCKRSLTMGKHFTSQAVRAKLKLWLLNGLDVPLANERFPRTWHVHATELKDLPVYTDAELDARLRARGLEP